MKITVYDIARMNKDYIRDEYNNFVNKNVTFNIEGKEYDGSFIFASEGLTTYYVKLKINDKNELLIFLTPTLIDHNGQN